MGKYLACSIAGRPVRLEGRVRQRVWEEVRAEEPDPMEALQAAMRPLTFNEEIEVLRD